MRIISVYNYYRNRGGEDEVFETEAALLERHGHEVLRYSKQNSDIDDINPLRLAAMTLWNHSAYRELVELIRTSEADIVHFHNTFPLISPAAYWAVKRTGIPVVQTLHNFRMICPNALLYRRKGVCEDCVGKAIALSGVIHRCYQDSYIASAGVAAMLGVHRMLRTWSNQVDAYIALTEFARTKFIQGGLPAEKILVKPNCLHPPLEPETEYRPAYALFVGRLSENKGLNVLLEAWRLLDGRLPLKIVGDGPLSDSIASAIGGRSEIELTGRLARAEVSELMKQAAMMIVPSTWYEGMPMTIIEAYAAGIPVIASRLGAMTEIVRHGETGLLFEPGDARSLAASVCRLLDSPSDTERMTVVSRQEFHRKYSSVNNYERLIEIYRFASDSARQMERPAEAAIPAQLEK